MRKDRLDEEELLVNGFVGGETLTRQERETLRDEAKELQQRMDDAKTKPIAE
ncbi:hypothetical protein G3578_14305 [Brevibacillus sp. SYP-B805]|uniref:hypothetical protein n=1 Tax=Brevibacillus sp. SYP-B805 TaxID=1578199 RepID=UPI0013ED8959|nr:hypothetical protein [Brevibacillus sp. SYP-B805]NGQ96334.1 hypothetical protein [Brevibacillus sp. SYP-B805]